MHEPFESAHTHTRHYHGAIKLSEPMQIAVATTTIKKKNPPKSSKIDYVDSEITRKLRVPSLPVLRFAPVWPCGNGVENCNLNINAVSRETLI